MDNSTFPTCPWCRCEIKGTESVVIEPFHKEGDSGNSAVDSSNEDAKLVEPSMWKYWNDAIAALNCVDD